MGGGHILRTGVPFDWHNYHHWLFAPRSVTLFESEWIALLPSNESPPTDCYIQMTHETQWVSFGRVKPQLYSVDGKGVIRRSVQFP